MTTKEKLLELLEKNRGKYVSGEEISNALAVSRTAIWKAINSLRNEGYEITAVHNKGYCLSNDTDILSVQGITKYLDYPENLDIQVYNTVDSTNTMLKNLATEGAKEGTCIIAAEQTAGRGRIGRKFYSPSGTGVYLSLLLRPGDVPASKSINITTMAAVAVCMAIEDVTGKNPGIKWVNDVFLDNKKVCGILTEGALSMENGYLEYIVLGVGFNAYLPEGEGFPEELKQIAGAIYDSQVSEGKNLLAAKFLNHFQELYNEADEKRYYEEYKKCCFVIGKAINVITPKETKKATAIDLDSECHLIVKYENGEVEALSSGEISVRVNE